MAAMGYSGNCIRKLRSIIMGDVTSVVLGNIHLKRVMPEGQPCDHCSELATQRIQGETDSFGAEWIDACDIHAEWIRSGKSFTECVFDGCGKVFIIEKEYDYSKSMNDQPEQIFCSEHRSNAETP